MIPLFGVDAFTTRPFSGNPAAVCLLEDDRPDEWKQSLAAEMNLSETAFVTQGAAPELFELRWFTPTMEVDLCGHATLASAHVMWEKEIIPGASPVIFKTKSGDLVARKSDDGITLDFPRINPEPAEAPNGLIEAFGAGFKSAAIMRAGSDYLIETDSAEDIKRLAPNLSALKNVKTRGVIVTASGGGADFVSRFFAPAAGIDEDPVTGSAHCALGPYWAPRLRKTSLSAKQLSRRGGELKVEVKDERVILTGQAVTVWEGVVSV